MFYKRSREDIAVITNLKKKSNQELSSISSEVSTGLFWFLNKLCSISWTEIMMLSSRLMTSCHKVSSILSLPYPCLLLCYTVCQVKYCRVIAFYKINDLTLTFTLTLTFCWFGGLSFLKSRMWNWFWTWSTILVIHYILIFPILLKMRFYLFYTSGLPI